MRKRILFLCLISIISLVTLWLWSIPSNKKYFFQPLIHRVDNIKNYIKPNKSITSVPSQKDISKNRLFDLNFEYLLNNLVCDKGNRDIYAVILVTSYYANVETRSAMRRAFLNEELIGFDMRRVFLIGLPPKSEKYGYKSVLDENKRYGDLIQGNFIEAYRNLTYKHMMGLRWATKYCSNAKYIIKMDDDIVVDIYKLSDYIHNNKNRLPNIEEREFAGYVLKNMVPKRESTNKWFVTYKEYPSSGYPPFLSGWFYIVTQPAARSIVDESKNYPYFWIDDVYVTGIVAHDIGIKYLDISRIFTPHPEFLQCCMTDLKKHKYSCPIIVGPNGGDNNLFYTYNEVMSNCFIYKCRIRKKRLNDTCVAERKTHLGRGEAFVETIHIV